MADIKGMQVSHVPDKSRSPHLSRLVFMLDTTSSKAIMMSAPVAKGGLHLVDQTVS